MSDLLKKFLHIAITSVIAIILLSGCLNPSQDSVLQELNADRRAHELRALNVNWNTQGKAQAWADKLARENKLYHSTLYDGITVKWCSLGENVGYGATVEGIEAAYMASPSHRANILSTKWNGVGVGYAKTADGSRIYTVQVFIKTC